MPDYRHTQIGYLMLTALGVVVVMLWNAGEPSSGGQFVVLLVVGLALLSFSRLTTVVTGNQVEVFFGLGLIRRRIDLNDVLDVRVVRNPWYVGWGIRWIGRGWLWNVSGSKAVELGLPEKRRFRIGSDEPEVLAEALWRKLEARGVRR